MRYRAVLLFSVVLLISSFAYGQDQASKNGNIDVRSTLVGTRIYLDDAYVGDADMFIEDVPPGDHTLILRQGGQKITGQFTVKAGETLMVEGRFEENKIVDLKETAREEAAKRAEIARKSEAERKAAAEAERKKREQEQARAAEERKKKGEKKIVASVPARTARGAEEERRDAFLNVFKAEFADAPNFEVLVTPHMSPKVVSNFNDNKSMTGKIYKSKQNYMLCEGGGCFRDWTSRFFYNDEAGKRDAFLVRWRETVYTGITPAGTSKQELDVCLNGDCKHMVYNPEGVTQGTLDRFVITWNKNAFTIRRSDLLKEITDAGGRAPAF